MVRRKKMENIYRWLIIECGISRKHICQSQRSMANTMNTLSKNIYFLCKIYFFQDNFESALGIFLNFTQKFGIFTKKIVSQYWLLVQGQSRRLKMGRTVVQFPFAIKAFYHIIGVSRITFDKPGISLWTMFIYSQGKKLLCKMH